MICTFGVEKGVFEGWCCWGNSWEALSVRCKVVFPLNFQIKYQLWLILGRFGNKNALGGMLLVKPQSWGTEVIGKTKLEQENGKRGEGLTR